MINSAGDRLPLLVILNLLRIKVLLGERKNFAGDDLSVATLLRITRLDSCEDNLLNMVEERYLYSAGDQLPDSTGDKLPESTGDKLPESTGDMDSTLMGKPLDCIGKVAPLGCLVFLRGTILD